jgi:hypothetical protein
MSNGQRSLGDIINELRSWLDRRQQASTAMGGRGKIAERSDDDTCAAGDIVVRGLVLAQRGGEPGNIKFCSVELPGDVLKLAAQRTRRVAAGADVVGELSLSRRRTLRDRPAPTPIARAVSTCRR